MTEMRIFKNRDDGHIYTILTRPLILLFYDNGSQPVSLHSWTMGEVYSKDNLMSGRNLVLSVKYVLEISFELPMVL